MLKYQPFDFPQVMRRDASIASQQDWIEPELALTIGTSDMDMRWLIALVRIEVKTVSSDAKDSRHGIQPVAVSMTLNRI